MAMQDTNATNIEVVALSDVRDDPAWVTDEAKVEGLRAVLRAHKQFPTPVMRRVWAPDGAFHYTIIDGFHRIRALVAEKVASYPMMVRECTEREEELDRISASLDKPDPVLHSRAIQVLRQAFVRDMLGVVENHRFLGFRRGDDGILQTIQRNGPLPTDPLMAMVVLHNHFEAAEYRFRGKDGWPPKTKAPQWARQFNKWLVELAAQFGVDNKWIIQTLGVSLLASDDADGTKERVWSCILDLGDEEIQRIVLARVKGDVDHQTTTAIHYCFPSDSIVKANPEIRIRSRQEAIRLFAGHDAQDLWLMWRQDEFAYKVRQQELRKAEQERHHKEFEEQLLREQIQQSPQPSQPASEAVFAVAPQRVAPGHAALTLPVPPTPQAVAAPRPIVANYAPCLDAATMLFDEWAAYEANGGNWQARDVQAHLQRILAYVQERIKAN